MPSASLAGGAALGAIESASLAVALIGQGLALARGLVTKRSFSVAVSTVSQTSGVAVRAAEQRQHDRRLAVPLRTRSSPLPP